MAGNFAASQRIKPVENLRHEMGLRVVGAHAVQREHDDAGAVEIEILQDGADRRVDGLIDTQKLDILFSGRGSMRVGPQVMTRTVEFRESTDQ